MAKLITALSYLEEKQVCEGLILNINQTKDMCISQISLEEALNQIRQQSIEYMICGAIKLQRLTANISIPVLEDLIKTQTIPFLINLCQSSDEDYLRYELSWIFLNLAQNSHADILLEQNIIPLINDSLVECNDFILENVILLIGNIAAHSLVNRTKLVHSGCLDLLVQYYQKQKETMSIQKMNDLMYALLNLLVLTQFELISSSFFVYIELLKKSIESNDKDFLQNSLSAIFQISKTDYLDNLYEQGAIKEVVNLLNHNEFIVASNCHDILSRYTLDDYDYVVPLI